MNPSRPLVLNLRASAALFHAVCLAIALAMLYPLLWMAASSFKESSQVFVEQSSLVPSHPTFANYAQGWYGFGGVRFGRFFLNSLVISALSTIGELLSATLAAYAFARIRFTGRSFWFSVMIVTVMLPFQVIMIPQYVLFRALRWTDSFKPLIIPHFFANTPFFVFMIMQFVRGIPRELDEAAIIDGCTRYGILFRITVPLITAALTTTTIFSFYWQWQDFLKPLLFLNRVSRYPVSLAMKLFSDPSTNTDWGAIFAMGTLSLVPVSAVFFLFQRFLVEGISISGLKG